MAWHRAEGMLQYLGYLVQPTHILPWMSVWSDQCTAAGPVPYSPNVPKANEPGTSDQPTTGGQPSGMPAPKGKKATQQAKDIARLLRFKSVKHNDDRRNYLTAALQKK